MSKNTTLEDFKMISLAKEKEYLDLEEGGEALTQELVGHEPIDDMLLIFEETDIQLLDAAPRGRSKDKLEEERTEEEEEAEIRWGAEVGAKTTDPVKMYLKEMGYYSLLTREGEVEIAKRIEEGKHEVINALLESPVGIKEFITLGEKFQQGIVKLREIVRDSDDEEPFIETEAHRKKVLQLFLEVKTIYEKNIKLQEKLGQDLVAARKKKIKDQIDENKHRIVERLKELRLDKRQIDRVVNKLRAFAERIEKGEAEIQEAVRRVSIPLVDLKKPLRKFKQDGQSRSLMRLTGLSKEELLDLDRRVRNGERKVRRVEQESKMTSKFLKKILRQIENGEYKAKICQIRTYRGQPASGGQHRQEIHQSRLAVSGPDPGGQYRTDEGGG